MKIFVSYTQNDGIVTMEKLRSIKNFLSKKHDVFIHAIESTNKNIGQSRVINELLISDVVLLLYSEGCLKSKWVILEIEISNLLNIPIVSVDAKKTLA